MERCWVYFTVEHPGGALTFSKHQNLQSPQESSPFSPSKPEIINEVEGLKGTIPVVFPLRMSTHNFFTPGSLKDCRKSQPPYKNYWRTIPWTVHTQFSMQVRLASYFHFVGVFHSNTHIASMKTIICMDLVTGSCLSCYSY